jgi:hypothetical protein
MLGAGTFKISGQGLVIMNSSITLRGAGPDKTKLVQDPSAQFPVLIFGPRWYKWGFPTAFASDAVKGGNSVTLVSNPGLTVGEIVHVNETYDPAFTYLSPERQNGDYQGWGEGRTGPQADARPLGQAMEVAAINGNVVTFSDEFHTNFRTNHAAHLVRVTDGTSKVFIGPKWSGIESLAVADGRGGDGGGNIRMYASSYCWAKNIESSGSAGASFAFDGSFRCELRDSYLHSTVNPNPGGDGYGLVYDTYSADCLAENNVVWNFNKVMAMRSSGGGNVTGYNYMQDAYGGGYPTIVELGMNASHMTTPHFELFEGNESFNFDAEAYWGNSIYVTIYRNHWTCLRASAGGLKLSDQQNRRCAALGQYSWNFSYVGNVLGFDGMPTDAPMPGGNSLQTGWQYEGGYEVEKGKANVWQFTDANKQALQPTDATYKTILRDANYDYFTKTTRWHGIGGSGLGTTPNPLPRLRDSLYMSGKPAFFGNNPWPWVDGSNASNPLQGSLPAKTRFDAGTPNQVP